MLEYFSKDIIKMLKIAIVITVVLFLTGVVLQIKALYFACFLGCLVSIFNIVSLYRDCQRIMYFPDRVKSKVYSQFFRRFVIYGIVLYIVGYITQRFKFGRLELNMLFCGLGLLNFKISMYLSMMFRSKKIGDDTV